MKRFLSFITLALAGFALGVWAETAQAADETIDNRGTNPTRYYAAFTSGTGDWECIFLAKYAYMSVYAETADVVVRVYPYRSGSREPVTVKAGTVVDFIDVSGYYLDRSAATAVEVLAQGVPR